MNSFMKWVSLEKAHQKVINSARALFAIYFLLDVAGVTGLCFSFYGEDRHAIWPFVAMMIGFVPLCLTPYLLYDYFCNKLDPYSTFTLIKTYPEQAPGVDADIRSSEYFGGRLAVSMNAIYSLKSSYYIPMVIPVQHIVWIYFEHTWHYGRRQHSPNLYILTKSNKTYHLPLGGKLLLTGRVGLDSWILMKIRDYFPHVFIGDTPENKRLSKHDFDQMVCHVESHSQPQCIAIDKERSSIS